MNKSPYSLIAKLAFGISLLCSTFSFAQSASNTVNAGDLIVEPATLIALGFEWYVDGDKNRNAAVAVSYRKAGYTDWLEGLPLLRIAEEVNTASYGPLPFIADNMFAGSIFDLDEDTEYEVRLVMSDPDGANGETSRTVNIKTRAEPMPAVGGNVYHVYPHDWEGELEQPAFYGLPSAYFDGNNIAADHFNVYPHRVKAGDTILVHAGVYKDERYVYAASASGPAPRPPGPSFGEPLCCGATFYGTYFLTAKGTAEKPVVIKGAGDGEAIFDGNGAAALFNVMGSEYHYFEDLTFRNVETVFQAGHKEIAGAIGLTVKHSKFEDIGEGIHTDFAGSKDFYIADNLFIGRHHPELLVGFSIAGASSQNIKLQANPDITAELSLNRSQYAVKVYGSGHVVAFNTMRNFHDGIDHHTYGMPVGFPELDREFIPVANDYYNNHISNMHDDCIEADGGVYNFRILRNLCVNAAGAGISFQPFFAGPVYLVRNIVYHVPGNFAALKFAGVSGVVAYNNTFIAAVRSAFGPTANNHFRNNLIFAEFPHEPALTMTTSTAYTSFDYNGYRSGEEAPAAFIWQAPADGVTTDFNGNLERQQFESLADFTTATGQDVHSRMLDYTIFEDLEPSDVDAVWLVYDPDELNFNLNSTSAAVDVGVMLPGVTDDFTGAGPDLGAYEVGVAVPHYGVRD